MTGWLLALALAAQLPPSGALAAGDRGAFQAEVARLNRQLQTSPDKAVVTFQLARTYASAKQWPETISWLRKVVDLNAGFDPSRDPLFTPLDGTKEYAAIVDAARESTPPISHSKTAFKIDEGDLAPENLAYNPSDKNFYFGSMRKRKLIRCSGGGDCSDFAGGLDTVLGLKVHGQSLWLLNNSDRESALIELDLASGAMLHKFSVPGPGHLFNDLIFAPDGDIYFTDTRAAAVWRLAGDQLKKLPGKFPAANGIAISPGGQWLFVSTSSDGVTILDLKSQTASPIARPAGLSLAFIDGLYFHKGSLIAIQNGPISPRVV